MLANRILSACGGTTEEKLYVDDVFSSYLRTGTGADVTVNTGIDMTKGYMLWSKSRSAATDHAVYDSARGVTYDLVTNSTAAQTTQSTGLKAVSSTGHTIGSLAKMNTSGATYVDFVFRKAPKFFDVVTYTGNGTNRTIAHNLGSIPGMIIVKNASSGTLNWNVYHRSLGATKFINFNQNIAAVDDVASNRWNAKEPTSSVFSIGTVSETNSSGSSIVAYLFAHDTSADGIIQCGSFTTDASGNGSYNHGWSKGVQFCKIKAASASGDWEMFDTARTPAWSGSDARLRANLSNAEDSVTRLSASGTSLNFTGLSANTTYIGVFIVAP